MFALSALRKNKTKTKKTALICKPIDIEIFRKRKVPGLKQGSLGEHPDGWGRQADTNRL